MAAGKGGRRDGWMPSPAGPRSPGRDRLMPGEAVGRFRAEGREAHLDIKGPVRRAPSAVVLSHVFPVVPQSSGVPRSSRVTDVTLGRPGVVR